MDLKDKRQELEDLVVEAENYRRRLEVVQREIRVLEASCEEIRATQNTFSALKENKVGTNILVPVGGGCFLKAQIADSEKVLVGVGAGVTVEKDVVDAEKFLAGRLEEILKAVEKMRKTAYELNERLLLLEEQSKDIVEELQSKKQ